MKLKGIISDLALLVDITQSLDKLSSSIIIQLSSETIKLVVISAARTVQVWSEIPSVSQQKLLLIWILDMYQEHGRYKNILPQCTFRKHFCITIYLSIAVHSVRVF